MRALASTTALVVALVLGAMAAVAPRPAHATPGKDGCAMIPVSAQPTIDIYGPNTWCLDHDIVVTQDESVISLITLHMSDITIDCRGHLLEYQGTADFAYGIVTADAAERITVRNCRFRGLSSAIALGDSDGNVIEDNIVHSSRVSVFGQSTAIEAYGTVTIRRNRVYDSITRAIAAGEDSTITDNLIDGVSDTPQDSYIVGIDLWGGGVEVAHNTIRGLHHYDSDQAYQIFPLQLSDTGSFGRRVEVSDNVFVQQGGDEGNVAIGCFAVGARIADNVFTGYTFPTNCEGFDAGANDVSP